MQSVKEFLRDARIRALIRHSLRHNEEIARLKQTVKMQGRHIERLQKNEEGRDAL